MRVSFSIAGAVADYENHVGGINFFDICRSKTGGWTVVATLNCRVDPPPVQPVKDMWKKADCGQYHSAFTWFTPDAHAWDFRCHVAWYMLSRDDPAYIAMKEKMGGE